MAAEGYEEYFRQHEADDRQSATHVAFIETAGTRPLERLLKVGDEETGQLGFAQMVAELNEAKNKVVIKEYLKTTSTFALHFDIVLQTEGAEVQRTLKKLCKMLTQCLLAHVYPDLEGVFAYIFAGTSPDGSLRGQVVYPEIVVNTERHGHIRGLMLEKMNGTKIAEEMVERHPGNTPDRVVRKCLGEVEVPLCATFGFGASSFGPHLDFIDLGQVKPNSVASQPAPDKLNISVAGCKRRDQRSNNAKMTQWTPPASAQQRKGKTGAGTGSGGTGTTSTTTQGSGQGSTGEGGATTTVAA